MLLWPMGLEGAGVVGAVEVVGAVGAVGGVEVGDVLGVFGVPEDLGGDGTGVVRKKVVLAFALEGAAAERDTIGPVPIALSVFTGRGGRPVPPWLG